MVNERLRRLETAQSSNSYVADQSDAASSRANFRLVAGRAGRSSEIARDQTPQLSNFVGARMVSTMSLSDQR